MCAQRLPDTGGYYFDAPRRGVVATIRGNVQSAVDALRRGDAGAGAVAFVVALGALAAIKRVWREVK